MQGPKWPFLLILILYEPDVVISLLLRQVYTLGRAPRTKETLPDFHEWCRVTRHQRLFRRLTGCQQTPRFWGVTRAMSKIHLNQRHANCSILQLTKFMTPQIRGSCRQPVNLWNSCGFWVTRYHMVVSYLSGSIFPQKIGQCLLCSGSSTQHTTCITVIHKSLFQHSYT